MDNKPCPEIAPWYKGFKGKIQKVNDKQYISRGIYTKLNSCTIKKLDGFKASNCSSPS